MRACVAGRCMYVCARRSTRLTTSPSQRRPLCQKSPGNRRAVSSLQEEEESCSSSFASTYLTRIIRTPLIVLITSFTQPHSQPASFLLRCAALRCDAMHCTPLSLASLSLDLSATADLALPVSLALPRLPACLSHLLASYSSWAPGSEVGEYPSTCADSLGLDGGEGPGST
jgi:hypothetical protein